MGRSWAAHGPLPCRSFVFVALRVPPVCGSCAAPVPPGCRAHAAAAPPGGVAHVLLMCLSCAAHVRSRAALPGPALRTHFGTIRIGTCPKPERPKQRSGAIAKYCDTPLHLDDTCMAQDSCCSGTHVGHVRVTVVFVCGSTCPLLNATSVNLAMREIIQTSAGT